MYFAVKLHWIILWGWLYYVQWNRCKYKCAIYRKYFPYLHKTNTIVFAIPCTSTALPIMPTLLWVSQEEIHNYVMKNSWKQHALHRFTQSMDIQFWSGCSSCIAHEPVINQLEIVLQRTAQFANMIPYMVAVWLPCFMIWAGKTSSQEVISSGTEFSWRW